MQSSFVTSGEAVSAVPDQQLSIVQLIVSELCEVVVSQVAHHPSTSEIVMTTATEQ